jgi:membrane fusion protein
MSLFRPEVHQAQAAQWLGSVRLHRPLSFAVLTTAALGLTAQQSGVLRQLPIAEGQTVKAGDVLLVLYTERQSLLNGTMGDTTERAAQHILARQQSLSTERTLRQLQTRQREDVLTDRIRTLQAELRQAEEEGSLQQRRVQLARTTLARNEQLAASGFVAAAQVQTKQEELIDADGRLQSLERTRLALQQDLQALQGERSALSAQLQTDLA